MPVDALMNEQDNRAGPNRMDVAMATPVLAIKPPGVMGNMRVSAAPTSILDVPATIGDLPSLKAQFDGRSVFSISNEAPRLRRHLYYRYGMNPDAEGYLLPILEWGVYGSTLDASAWHFGALHLPAVSTKGGTDAP